MPAPSVPRTPSRAPTSGGPSPCAADRHDWTRDEVAALWARPLLDLVFDAAAVHRARHPGGEVQRATLLSVKTGGCPEDCAYCPQAARYQTGVEREALLDL